MKGLAIKGKIHVWEVPYKVLFSDLLQAFVTLPTDTQLRMVQVMIREITINNDLNELQEGFAKAELDYLKNLIDNRKLHK